MGLNAYQIQIWQKPYLTHPNGAALNTLLSVT